MVRVVVLAESCLYRESLAEALSARPEVDVVGVADGGDQLLSVVDEVNPDLALVDYGLAACLPAIRRMAVEWRGIPLVAFCVPDCERDVVGCFEAGAAGYVPHGASIEDLLHSIADALRGELRCGPRVAGILGRRVAGLAIARGLEAGGSSLTARELEVVELIDQGLSNKEIARRLGIRLATVKNHVHNILEKLHVSRRGEAAALVNGRLSFPPAAGGTARNGARLGPSD